MAVEGPITFDRAGCIGRCDRFTTEHTLYAYALFTSGSTMVFAQAVTQLGQQRIVRDAREVVYVNLVCQAFTASRAHSDEANTFTQGPLRQAHFGLDLVAGVYDRIGLTWQQCRPVLGAHKIVHRIYLAMRVNQSDALRHGLHFGLACCAAERVDLSVDVGL